MAGNQTQAKSRFSLSLGHAQKQELKEKIVLLYEQIFKVRLIFASGLLHKSIIIFLVLD